MTFHILGIIIPTDFHIFQRGRSTTNQKSFDKWLSLCWMKTLTPSFGSQHHSQLSREFFSSSLKCARAARAGFFASPLHPAFTKQPRVIKHGNGKNMAMAKELNLIQFADSTFLFKSMDGDFRLSALLEGLWQPADVKILLSWSFMTSRQPTMPSVATMRRKALCWPPLIQTFARIWPCCKRSLECLAIFVDQFHHPFSCWCLVAGKEMRPPGFQEGCLVLGDFLSIFWEGWQIPPGWEYVLILM